MNPDSIILPPIVHCIFIQSLHNRQPNRRPKCVLRQAALVIPLTENKFHISTCDHDRLPVPTWTEDHILWQRFVFS